MRATVKWYFVGLATLCLGGVAHPEGGEAIDPAWLARARTEAKAVYEKHKALSARLEEESEYRMDRVPGSVGTMPLLAHSRRDRVVRLDDNMILERIRILDNDPTKPQIQLLCDNNDYHFTLSKSREDGPYVLVEYKLGKRKNSLIQQQPGLHNTAFSDLGAVLAAIDNDGKHTLRKLRFDDAKRLLLIEYTFVAGDLQDQNHVYIDPSHDWRVVENRVETPNLAGMDRWSYGARVGGLEFPTEFKDLTTHKMANAPPDFEITGRLISLKITDKKPEDFRLSAFGFPEPIDAPPLPKPTPWYLWVLVAAVASAALAMLFAWLKRRHTTTTALSSKAS